MQELLKRRDSEALVQVAGDFPIGLAPFQPTQHLRQLPDLLRADYNINMGHPPENLFAFLLGHTAGYSDPQAGLLLFLLPERTEQTENLLFRLGPDGAGIEDNQVGICLFGNRDIAALRQELLHDFRVALVHLAAEGFDKEMFIHG